MDKILKEKIIKEYLSGKGSTTIAKLLKTHKPGVLKVIKDAGLTRKRNRCESLDIINDGGKYSIIRECPKCNKQIKTTSKDKIIACRNHFNAINSGNLCKPCSLELQVGQGNPFYGKTHTKETKEKISKSREGKATGKGNSMSKQKWRDKARKNLIKKWESGDLENTRKFMSEKLKETRRLGKLTSVIVSKKEKEILKEIKKMGFDVIGSHKVDTKICDIYIPSLNLIIEYNGDYWHCNPKKYNSNYFNKKKSKYAWEIWEYDKNKLELIKNNGYTLEVIWESDFKNNNKIINHIIEKYVTNNSSTPERSRQN
jgi:G:T-mismatch repair DNA endonuclease (very short patch repair protein)